MEITTERPIITRVRCPQHAHALYNTQRTTQHSPRQEVIVQDSGVVAHKPTVGQKLKGTVKELSGAVTRNPAKEEEGRMLKRGMATTQPAYM